MSLKFQYSENTAIQKEITVEIDVSDYNCYRKSLKSVQTTVNEYLTELINKEGAPEEPSKDEELSDSDTEENKEQKCSKRDLSVDREVQKPKVKVLKI